MTITESGNIIREYKNREALHRFLQHRMFNDMFGVNPIDPKENLKREIITNLNNEVRYINILGIFYILICRSPRDILDNYSEPWGCISYSFLNYKDRVAYIDLLKYAREKYQITLFIPKGSKDDISLFEEAGYFNFGDPSDQKLIIMRSKDDNNLLRFDRSTIGSMIQNTIHDFVSKKQEKLRSKIKEKRDSRAKKRN